MVEQKLDTLITLLIEMLIQIKKPNQGTPIKNEGSSKHAPSLQIMESYFTPKWTLENDQKETNMEEVLQEYLDKPNISEKLYLSTHIWKPISRKIRSP